MKSDCGQNLIPPPPQAQNWDPNTIKITSQIHGLHHLIFLQDLLREDEVVDEVLILGHQQLRLDNLLSQLHLQNTEDRKK